MKIRVVKTGKRLGQRQPLSLLDYMAINILRLFYSPVFSILFLMLLWLGYLDYLGTASANNQVLPKQVSPSAGSGRR